MLSLAECIYNQEITALYNILPHWLYVNIVYPSIGIFLSNLLRQGVMKRKMKRERTGKAERAEVRLFYIYTKAPKAIF